MPNDGEPRQLTLLNWTLPGLLFVYALPALAVAYVLFGAPLLTAEQVSRLIAFIGEFRADLVAELGGIAILPLAAYYSIKSREAHIRRRAVVLFYVLLICGLLAGALWGAVYLFQEQIRLYDEIDPATGNVLTDAFATLAPLPQTYVEEFALYIATLLGVGAMSRE